MFELLELTKQPHLLPTSNNTLFNELRYTIPDFTQQEKIF